ncbi:MAG: ribonuclease HII [Candidatus Omnitrophica bacterium]|nr:ribonuclease HII [Candidatus Omnitrophota bacterium]
MIEFDKTKANGFRFVFGVDEAGRGPLAGPVVAAAVHLCDINFSSRVGDSKVLSERQREKAFGEIHQHACVGVGVISETVIDQINILRASHLAMTVAVQDLSARMDTSLGLVKVLIDGNSYQGDIPYKIECVVKGDAKSFVVACASIVAKVTRDRMMEAYHKLYPQYGFLQHKGYPTQAHRTAIKKFGLTPIHRKTFRVL